VSAHSFLSIPLVVPQKAKLVNVPVSRRCPDTPRESSYSEGPRPLRWLVWKKPCYRGGCVDSSAVASLSLSLPASLCGGCAADVLRVRVSVSGRAGCWFDSARSRSASVRCGEVLDRQGSGLSSVVEASSDHRRRCSRGVAVSVWLELCVWIPRGLGRQRMASRHRQREAHDLARVLVLWQHWQCFRRAQAHTHASRAAVTVADADADARSSKGQERGRGRGRGREQAQAQAQEQEQAGRCQGGV
jgi:hypothetical protein